MYIEHKILFYFHFYLKYLKRKTPRLILIGFFIFSVIMSILVYQLLLNQEQQLFQQDAEKAHHLIRERIQLYQSTLHTLKSFFEATPQPITTGGFRRYYESLHAEQQLPALHSLGYLTTFTSQEKALLWRTQFRLANPALAPCVNQAPFMPNQTHFLLLQHLEPLQNTCQTLGADVSLLPFRLETAQAAIRFSFASTPPIILHSDKKHTYRAIVMMMPITKKSPTQDKHIIGFITATFKIHIMLHHVMTASILQNNHIKIIDITDRKRPYFVYENRPSSSQALDFSTYFIYENTINLANRTWHIRVTGMKASYGNESFLFSLIFFGIFCLFNLCFFVLLCWYLNAKEQSTKLNQTLSEREVILRATGAGLFWVQNERIIWVNARFLEIVGLSAETVQNTSPKRFYLHEQDFIRSLPHHHLGLQQKGHFSFETQWVNAEKQPIWCWLTGCLFDKNNPDYGMLWTLEDISHKKKREQEIYHMAYHDPLTGLFNRRAFHEKLNYALLMAKQYHEKLAVFFIDLDHFKNINDTFGHDIGDLLLIHVANQLKYILQSYENAVAIRLAGDEFVVLLPHFVQKETLSDLANQFILSLKGQQHIGGQVLYLSPSIGIAIYPEHGTTPEILQEHADNAMYYAKKAGRGQYCFFSHKV